MTGGNIEAGVLDDWTLKGTTEVCVPPKMPPELCGASDPPGLGPVAKAPKGLAELCDVPNIPPAPKAPPVLWEMLNMPPVLCAVPKEPPVLCEAELCMKLDGPPEPCAVAKVKPPQELEEPKSDPGVEPCTPLAAGAAAAAAEVAAAALTSGSGCTPYFLQTLRYMTCSWPLYFAMRLSTSLSFPGLCCL
mmetsp:Transcript_25201/g.69276  ORF Transcript_25201/g.69276 Transcript_25201/m.69276 type:complete len:190 (-) Transcript_25201:672-1241(-)